MGGLYTSVRDYARYVAFQLDAWPPRDEPERGPVRRSSVREAQQMARFNGFRVVEMGADLRATASGYGFGWGSSQTCDFELVVTHGGGLPGFGSYVYLVPAQGAGLFAMTNATYAGPSMMLAEAARSLEKKGALSKRTMAVSPALFAAQQVIADLLAHWDQRRAAQVFDRTFFQYNPPNELSARLRSAADRHGPCRPVGSIVPENALRGTLHLNCDRGQLDAHIALSPDNPPLIQWVQLHSRLPPSERVLEMLHSLTEQIRPDRAASVGELLAPTIDKQNANEQLSRAGSRHGPCQLERWLDGDGQSTVRAQLRCRDEPLQLALRFDSSGQIEQLDLQPARAGGSRCTAR